MNSISHMMIFCRDQDEAKAFYTEKIGLECSADVPIAPDHRWLTFNHPDNPDFNLCIMPTGAGPYGPEIGERQAELLALGGMMGGILNTDDCRRDYEMLKARGVEFTEEPEERFYGDRRRLPRPVRRAVAAHPARGGPRRCAELYVSRALEKASASNGRRSSRDSPIPISLTGMPSSLAMARAMPPLAVPSSLVRMMPVTSTASPNSLA